MPPSPPPSYSSTSSPPRPPALQAPNDRSTRPLIIGDESGPSSPPFPIYLSGSVQRGFGRGGKELGCPTANLPSRLLQPGGQGGGLSEAPTGIYFGYGRVLSREEGGKGQEYEDREQKKAAASSSTESHPSITRDLNEEETRVHPMVMSLGWNPFYDNKTKTAEVHLMHPFSTDFYGLQIRVIVLGYIRPEYNYVDVEALKVDIDTDKKVAINSLQREQWKSYEKDEFFFRDGERKAKG